MNRCRAHERLWKNPSTNQERCVDKNLEDDWLFRLNNLKHLTLRNICEGHPGALGLNQQPHATIKLSLKEGPACTKAIISTLEQEGARFFDRGDTNVEIHEDEVQGAALSAWIDHACIRTSEEMDEATRFWFMRTVGGTETLDAFVDKLLYGNRRLQP